MILPILFTVFVVIGSAEEAKNAFGLTDLGLFLKRIKMSNELLKWEIVCKNFRNIFACKNQFFTLDKI